MADYEDILFTVEAGIATITLNRPERLNAFGTALRESLFQAADEVRRNTDIRVLIITGVGRAFCAGGDVGGQAERMSWDASERTRWILSGIPTLAVPPMLRRLDKPVIAAVNGVAAGAGFSIALACDIRIASENARFSMAFVKRGLIPDTGATYLLPRVVGTSKACEFMFTGDIIDAKEAERIGLVSRVVPQEELMNATMELATKISKGASIAIELTKLAIYRGLECSLESRIDTEVYSNSICYLAEDHQEGVKAFFEKREPVFEGK